MGAAATYGTDADSESHQVSEVSEGRYLQKGKKINITRLETVLW
jgi:hypothetical protein